VKMQKKGENGFEIVKKENMKRKTLVLGKLFEVHAGENKRGLNFELCQASKISITHEMLLRGVGENAFDSLRTQRVELLTVV